MSAPEPTATLERGLGSLASYALLVGILVGAGIFRVTSDASLATGPSVVLAHLVLAPVVLATSVAYLVFLSTSLGLEPGGEVLHVARTFGNERLTFLCAWLKVVSYLGAGAYLADALALNVLELGAPGAQHGALAARLLALSLLGAFLAVHLAGVRWLGRVQVVLCLVLAVALAVLVVPGLFAIEPANYRPFFTGGARGFGVALPSLFFAYAGFEALGQAAGEVRDSRTRLPRVFVRGILVTSVIFVSMSAVAFGVLPADEVGASGVPMSRAADAYLPFGGALVVTLGAVAAIATSLNATMLVPARMLWHLAREGRVPRVFGVLHADRRTPVVATCASFAAAALLLLSGRMELALGIAVVALMTLYGVHSLALLALPRRAPALNAEVRVRIPRALQVACASASVLALSALVLLRFAEDARRVAAAPFAARVARLDLTSLELFGLWLALGLVLFRWSRGTASA